MAEHISLQASVRPYHSLLLADKPRPTEKVTGCAQALAIHYTKDSGIESIARVDLSIQTTRTVQITVKSVTARLSEAPAARFESLLRCSSSDWRERHVPTPGQVGFNDVVEIGDTGRYAIPVFKPDDLEPFFFSEDRAPELLPDHPQFVSEGRPLVVPLYLTNRGNSAIQYGYVLDVELVVNEQSHKVTVTNHGGQPFWIHSAPDSIALTEWLTDTAAWVHDRPYDAAKAAPFPIPSNRACQAVSIDDVAPIVGKPVWVHGASKESLETGSDHCNWMNANTGSNFHIDLKTYPSEEEAQDQYNLRIRVNSATTDKGKPLISLQNIGDRGSILGVRAYVQYKRDYMEFGYALGPGKVATSKDLERMATIIASRLGW